MSSRCFRIVLNEYYSSVTQLINRVAYANLSKATKRKTLFACNLKHSLYLHRYVRYLKALDRYQKGKTIHFHTVRKKPFILDITANVIYWRSAFTLQKVNGHDWTTLLKSCVSLKKHCCPLLVQYNHSTWKSKRNTGINPTRIKQITHNYSKEQFPPLHT